MNNTLTKFKAAPSSATSVSLVKARNQILSYYHFINGLFSCLMIIVTITRVVLIGEDRKLNGSVVKKLLCKEKMDLKLVLKHS